MNNQTYMVLNVEI